MDRYAKKMEKSSVRQLRIKLKKPQTNNKEPRFQHYEEKKKQGQP
jgi:hypothetical protein